MSIIRTKGTRKILLLVAATIVILWTVYPFWWSLICSLKYPKDIFTISYIPFLQFEPTLRNWVNEFIRFREIRGGLANSVIVATTSSLIALLLGTMAGYALARFRFQKMKNRDLALWFLSQRVFPPIVIIIPYFIMMKTFHLLDTRLALIFAYTTFNLPFSILIMREIFKELPEELEEAALVDGTSLFGAFLRIALPLSIPGVVTTTIICFAFSWNEFLFALILTYQNAVTIPVSIAGTEHMQGVEFWCLATRILVAVIPPVVLALFIQKYLVRGLTFGALKG